METATLQNDRCVLMDACGSVAQTSCSGRDFLVCHFFVTCLGEYCRKIKRDCKVCRYPHYCARSALHVGGRKR